MLDRSLERRKKRTKKRKKKRKRRWIRKKRNIEVEASQIRKELSEKLLNTKNPIKIIEIRIRIKINMKMNMKISNNN